MAAHKKNIKKLKSYLIKLSKTKNNVLSDSTNNYNKKNGNK